MTPHLVSWNYGSGNGPFLSWTLDALSAAGGHPTSTGGHPTSTEGHVPSTGSNISNFLRIQDLSSSDGFSLPHLKNKHTLATNMDCPPSS